jgi:hypothetical protein
MLMPQKPYPALAVPCAASPEHPAALPLQRAMPRVLARRKTADSLPSEYPSSPPAKIAGRESVASILDRDAAITIQRWLLRVRQFPALNALPISEHERTEYLPEMIRSITAQLRAMRSLESIDCHSRAAVGHGQLRYLQGYTAPLIVQESRILQVCIFETIQRNLSTVDFCLVLPDIMLIADEVDCQLAQAIDSFLMAQQQGVTPASAGTAIEPTSAH